MTYMARVKTRAMFLYKNVFGTCVFPLISVSQYGIIWIILDLEVILWISSI